MSKILILIGRVIVRLLTLPFAFMIWNIGNIYHWMLYGGEIEVFNKTTKENGTTE